MRRVLSLFILTALAAVSVYVRKAEARRPHDPGCDDVWTSITTTNAPTARDQYVSVWAGSEMIIWGGSIGGIGGTNTGARYNPGIDTWTPTSTTNAPAARNLFAAVWSGTEMIVWGGYTFTGLTNTGGRYNPATNTWAPISTVNAPSARAYHTAVWTGTEMIVWGGYNDSNGLLNTGGRYNPSTDTWTPINTTNAPVVRRQHTAVWTGTEMIVWGGLAAWTPSNTGGRYNPGTDAWSPTATTNAPAAREGHTAVWSGTEMIVWGGSWGASFIDTGGRYNPGTSTWTATSNANAPAARSSHTAVWTGTEMIIWGGGGSGNTLFNNGGRYNPGTSTWTSPTTANAPTARLGHIAVWTGAEKIVWGGNGNTGGRYCASSQASPPAGSPTVDLAPQNIALSPSAIAPGASLTVNWTLANIGTAAANAGSTTVVRISQSTTLAGVTDLASISTPALAAGASVAQSATLTVPSTPGTYYVWVIADRYDAVDQAIANDAQHSAAFTVTTSPPTVNMSHDLTALGIANQNATPNNPSLDARPLFQAAIDYAKTHPGISLLTVDPGAYYLKTATQGNATLFLGFISDLTVDLAESTLYFPGPTLPAFNGINVVGCNNVTLKNFQTEFINPPYTHVQLTTVDTAARVLSYSTITGWPNPSTFNSFSPLAIMWAVVFRNGKVVPGTTRMKVDTPISGSTLALIQDGTPWTQSGVLSTLQPGDVIAVAPFGGGPPLLVWEGDAVTLSNITIYGSPAGALQMYATTNSTVDGVRVMPRPGTGLIGSSADGIDFLQLRQNNHLRNSYVSGTLDDALTMVSQNAGTVVSKTGPRQLTVTRGSATANGYSRFPNGTLVNFVDPVTTLEFAGATIISQNPADSPNPGFNELVQLTFDQDLPATLPAGTGMVYGAAATRGQGSTIEDNIVEDTYGGRGIWIIGAQGITISRNVTRRTSMAGIIVHQVTSVYPGPPSRDITIRDNSLEGDLGPAATGTGDQEALGALEVTSTDNTAGFSTLMANTNINVLNNYIADSGRSGIWIGEVNGGMLQNNLVIRWNQHPEFPLFGIPPEFYDQVQSDRSVPIVVRYSSNLAESGDITQSSSPIAAPVTFASASSNFIAGGGSGSFSVSTAISGFNWHAAVSDGWITITSNADGTGNLTVGYSVAPNPGATGRSGTVTIAGQKFTITQQGRTIRRGQLTSQ